MDVSCEGFRGPNDPWVLRGSCALRYNLEYTSPDAGNPHIFDRVRRWWRGSERPAPVSGEVDDFSRGPSLLSLLTFGVILLAPLFVLNIFMSMARGIWNRLPSWPTWRSQPYRGYPQQRYAQQQQQQQQQQHYPLQSKMEESSGWWNAMLTGGLFGALLGRWFSRSAAQVQPGQRGRFWQRAPPSAPAATVAEIREEQREREDRRPRTASGYAGTSTR